MKDRRTRARDWRIQAAEQEFERPVAAHVNNGEESDYPFAGNYSKGLPHDEFGDVNPAAYRLLLRAVTTGATADFEAIPLGGTRPLTNPQSGLGLDTEGPDPAALAIPPAPRIDSPQNSSEAAELYWMALARDVPFTDFASSALIAEAAEDLSGFSDFRGPKAGGRVTPGTLFRGTTRGDLRGPYVSQFLLRDIPYGTLLVRQQIDTVAPTDWLTSFDDWLAVQNGAATPAERRDLQHRTFLHTPRDLAHYVHFDALYEAYLNACLILLGLDAPVDAGNPYTFSRNQVGFGTYGPPHVLSLVTEVASRALKAIWYQKWFVHRRLRPEEFGGRVHLRLTGARDFPIDPEILDSVVVKRTFDTFGSYLLPQAFPEGSPTHPAYGSGHAHRRRRLRHRAQGVVRRVVRPARPGAGQPGRLRAGAVHRRGRRHPHRRRRAQQAGRQHRQRPQHRRRALAHRLLRGGPARRAGRPGRAARAGGVHPRAGVVHHQPLRRHHHHDLMVPAPTPPGGAGAPPPRRLR